ncbi:MAG: ABC transporter permease [Gammaproteobacteria bacterium]
MSAGDRLAWLVLGLWVVAAVAAPFLGGAADTVVLERILEPPSWSAPGGYDDLGRPLGQRLAVGARLSLGLALVVVALSALLGTGLGLLAGWYGGWLDLLLVRVIDVFLAFPGILLAIALAAVLGPGIGNLVLALSAVGWVGYARLARAQTLSVRRRDHVLVAAALGTPPARAILRHVLPLVAGPLIVEATFGLASVVIAEAGLSFLGLGVQPPTPSWGSMIRDGTRYMLFAPHAVLVPGLALMSAVVAVNLLGDRLRDRWQSPVAATRRGDAPG